MIKLVAATAGVTFASMNATELAVPLTKRNAMLADFYDLRYPGIEISPGRKAWRGQNELNQGRATEAEIAAAPAKREPLSRAGMAITFSTLIDGRWVVAHGPLCD